MNNLAGLVSKSNKEDKQNLKGWKKLKIKSINNIGKLTSKMNKAENKKVIT